YQDFSNVKKIENLKEGEQVTIKGVVEEINTRKTWHKGLSITEATVSDETDSITVIWFNQPYLSKTIKPESNISLAGEVTSRNGRIQIQNPYYEINDSKNDTVGIIPIYSETKGITSRGIRNIIKPILEDITLKEWIPEKILKENNFPEINQALKTIHFPEKMEDIKTAQERFSFEDLFLMQIKNLIEKEENKEEKSLVIKKDKKYLDLIIKELPFTLTGSQKEVLKEIIDDLSQEYPMNRFLQGDVGSGKTIVVALAALQVAKEGYQTAFMAPTELLASQHYQTLKSLFPFFNEGLALLTASQGKVFHGDGVESSFGKQGVLDGIKNGEIKIVIGTHSLIQKKVDFYSLGLVVIDEQHRFGINQREALVMKGGKKTPHFLSLSATPIPRTLNLTLFGNLDISVIRELPKGRKKVVTKVIKPDKRLEAYKFIGQQIKAGGQAFVVCPRISSDNTNNPVWADVKAVKDEYEKLKRIFTGLEIAMIHGKINPYQKESIMKEFKNHKYDILVSTSVIEVGIDIPNASMIIIEGADRFGLAQIHQFRGRVGRGEHQSYCFLFSTSSNELSIKRLKMVEVAKDGFELAEKDLEIRGPGQFLGNNQSGMPDLIMKALQNPELVEKTKKSAEAIIKKDPKLKKFEAIREKIEDITLRTN
ncbi:MAG: ATP-dependent DNA helicase RecG, partial [Candidatus Paceibacterota bacterium]